MFLNWIYSEGDLSYNKLFCNIVLHAQSFGMHLCVFRANCILYFLNFTNMDDTWVRDAAYLAALAAADPYLPPYSPTCPCADALSGFRPMSLCDAMSVMQ